MIVVSVTQVGQRDRLHFTTGPIGRLDGDRILIALYLTWFAPIFQRHTTLPRDTDRLNYTFRRAEAASDATRTQSAD